MAIFKLLSQKTGKLDRLRIAKGPVTIKIYPDYGCFGFYFLGCPRSNPVGSGLAY
jgi:hypothetical protein